MKRFWIPLCFIAGTLMLLYSLYFWGGIASTPEVGALVQEHASTFSFLTWAYVSAGNGIVSMLGWQDSAAQFARSEVGGLFEAMKASPVTALDSLSKALPWFCVFSYYAGPLLLLIGAFAQSRKPKSFKTFGSK